MAHPQTSIRYSPRHAPNCSRTAPERFDASHDDGASAD
jgi:hypothetical protein